MVEKIEIWFRITEIDTDCGNQELKIYPLDLVKERLGLTLAEARIESLERQLNSQGHLVELLLAPLRQQRIMDLLGKEKKGRTFQWIFPRVWPSVSMKDIHTLVAEEKLKTTKSAHHTMYHVVGDQS